MQSDRILSMLGLCRRAGKLRMGHDTVEKSLFENKAYLVVFSADASERLKNELKVTAEKGNSKARFVTCAYSMNDFHYALGYKAGVLSVTDENFAVRLEELFGNG